MAHNARVMTDTVFQNNLDTLILTDVYRGIRKGLRQSLYGGRSSTTIEEYNQQII